jgi:hypothetical protein
MPSTQCRYAARVMADVATVKTIDRAKAEIERGRLWRAKDLLSGSLANYPYDPQLYFAYGDLLLRMGDLREAGKFLFLSGLGEANHTEAIDIFLGQFQSSTKKQLYSSFPSRARLATLSEYPATVADALRHKGFEEVIRHPLSKHQPRTIGTKVKDVFLIIFSVSALLFLCVGLVRGIILGAQTVYGWIKG